MIKKLLQLKGREVVKYNRDFPITRHLDTNGVEILGNQSFQESCSEIMSLTLLDTARLANLWDFSLLTNPLGNIIEIGAYKGGTSIHLSNANPERRIIVCDSFGKSFKDFKPELDSNFSTDQFTDNSEFAFVDILKQKKRNFSVINGFFPDSVAEPNLLTPISFCYIDVDTYVSTLKSLTYLETSHCFMEKSIIISDDYNRQATGVNKAIDDFVREFKHWQAFPLFPSQCLLLHKSFFQ